MHEGRERRRWEGREGRREGKREGGKEERSLETEWHTLLTLGAHVPCRKGLPSNTVIMAGCAVQIQM